MALSKEITLQNGVKATYHRISMLRLEISEKEETVSEAVETVIHRILYVQLLGYTDKSFREADAGNTAMSDDFYFELDQAESESNLRRIAYEKLKLIDKFADAIDC